MNNNGTTTNAWNGAYVNMICPFGIFDDVSVVQVGKKDSDCADYEDPVSIISSCNIASDTFFKDAFESCKGKSSCSVEFKSDATLEEFPGAPCLQPGPNTSLYMLATCAGENVEFTSFGVSISRVTLTYVIVACDMAICLLFVLNGVWINHWINKEEH